MERMAECIRRWWRRGLVYLLGLVILALGITLNTKTGLGVSPIVSIPYVAAVAGHWSLGDTTLVSYVIFLLFQILLLRRRFRWINLLQLPVSIAFTRFMNLFEAWIPEQTALPGQLLVLALAILGTGIGAAMSLDMRLVPNPGDGLVQALSDAAGKDLGLCKNLVDGSCVILAAAVSLPLLGHVAGIGLGTLAAMFGIGQVIAVFNRHLGQPCLRFAGMNPENVK